MRLSLHDLPRHYQDQISRQLNPVATKLPHPEPKHHAGEESLDINQDEEGGAGRHTVCITRYGAKLLDADNLGGGVKHTVDALRYEGLIPDDNPASLRLIIRQKKAKKGERGTLIEIFPPCAAPMNQTQRTANPKMIL